MTGATIRQPDCIPTMEVVVHSERDGLRLAPSGELDMATVGQLRDEVLDVIDAGSRRVVIDLRGLTFIDCAGLRLIDSLIDGARRRGCELSLVPGAVAHRLFELTGTQHAVVVVGLP